MDQDNTTAHQTPDQIAQQLQQIEAKAADYQTRNREAMAMSAASYQRAAEALAALDAIAVGDCMGFGTPNQAAHAMARLIRTRVTGTDGRVLAVCAEVLAERARTGKVHVDPKQETANE